MDMTNRRPVPGPLSAATTVVGVIGDPVAHSLSPLLHNTAFAVMGLDSQLIADGTYFRVECEGRLAGCGGWSRRDTLYGGDHTPGREPR